MNREGLVILMRTRMRAAAPAAASNQESSITPHPPFNKDDDNSCKEDSCSVSIKDVKEWMQSSITIPTGKSEPADANLEQFSQGYVKLPQEGRRQLLLTLSRDYDVSRARVRELMRQYLSLDIDSAVEDEHSGGGAEHENSLAALYRTERNLRDALKPMYGVFFFNGSKCTWAG